MIYEPGIIGHALQNAPPLERHKGQWAFPPTYDPLIDSIPPDAGHDYSVTFPGREAYDKPGYVCTDSVDALREAVIEYHDTIDLPVDQDTRTYIECQLKHEAQHGEAAIALEAASILYVLRVARARKHNVNAWRVGHIPIVLRTTKLGVAILNAYPEIPSPGDLWQIRELGYGSTDEVGALAEQYDLPIPLPTQNGQNFVTGSTKTPMFHKRWFSRINRS